MARFSTSVFSGLSAKQIHLIAGSSLAGLIVVVLLSIAIFGKADSAFPTASLDIPSLAEQSVIQAGLRAEQPEAELVAVAHQDDQDVRLPGISDLTQDKSQHTKTLPNKPKPENYDIPRSPDALAAAPLPGLTEAGPGGLLPKLGPKGEKPSLVYARPFEIDISRPVVSIVVGGLGMMQRTTQAAIDELPPEVTLSFVPYTPDLQTWINRARAKGHEVLIELPMEPFGYPETDPGPYTLLSSASSAENTRRLEWLLSRATGYFGVTNYMGSKLTASENAMAPVFRGLNSRGLQFLYDGQTRRSSLKNVATKEGLGWTTADRILDSKQTIAAIDDQLLRLEAQAIQNGSAIGKGFSWPVTIKQLKEWTGSLHAKGYQLAPVSAVIKMRNQDEKAGGKLHTVQNSAPKRH